MLEAKPTRLSRAMQLGARKSPSEQGSLLPVSPSPSRPHVPQGGCTGQSQGSSPLREDVGADAMTLGGGMWHRGSGALARAHKPCKAHDGFLQRDRNASAAPTPLWILARLDTRHWTNSLLSLSTTPDNEVWCIYNLFCLLCVLAGIHCPAAWITYWQLNKALNFCWLKVASSGTPNQQSYISLPWLEI